MLKKWSKKSSTLLLFEDRKLRSTTADTQDIATYTMARRSLYNQRQGLALANQLSIDKYNGAKVNNDPISTPDGATRAVP